jgi:hypothetical protein
MDWLPVSRPGDLDERSADAAAEAVSSGRPALSLAALAGPVVQGQFGEVRRKAHKDEVFARLRIDYAKARKQNTALAKLGSLGWEAKLATVAGGAYEDLADLWSKGEADAFADAVAGAALAGRAARRRHARGDGRGLRVRLRPGAGPRRPARGRFGPGRSTRRPTRSARTSCCAQAATRPGWGRPLGREPRRRRHPRPGGCSPTSWRTSSSSAGSRATRTTWSWAAGRAPRAAGRRGRRDARHRHRDARRRRRASGIVAAAGSRTRAAAGVRRCPDRRGSGRAGRPASRHGRRQARRSPRRGGRAGARRDQCNIDRQSLGLTLAESIQRGSVAYNGPHWNLVMTGDVLLPAGNLCTLPPGEVPAITRAIEAAEAVLGGSAAPRDYLRFNRAANSPPNPVRQEKAGQHEGHTFYRFRPGSECG